MSTLTSPSQPVILNNVFENAFGPYRNHILIVFSIAAVAQVSLVALQLAITSALGRGLPEHTSDLQRQFVAHPLSTDISTGVPLDHLVLFVVASLAVSLLQATLVSQFVSGVFTNAMMQQHFHKPISLANAYRLGWRRIIALLVAGTIATVVGLIVAGIGLSASWWIANALLAGDLRALSDINTAISVGTVVFLIIAVATIALIAIVMRFLFFPQAIVVEHTGALGGLRRSWQLTGTAFWRVLGSVALVWMLILIATGIPTACMNFVVQFMSPRPVEDLFMRQLMNLFVTNIAYIAALPLQLSAYTMLYFDLRKRNEGYMQDFE